jgi:hypothetical protein
MPHKGAKSAREVVVQFDDGTEQFVASGFTSDRAAIEIAQSLAHQHAGYHEAVRLGYQLPPEQRPGMAVLARHLRERPHHRAFYPGAMDALHTLGVKVPPAPEVHDYRTSRGREIRDDHQGHPWDLPRVQRLAQRFNWPAP